MNESHYASSKSRMGSMAVGRVPFQYNLWILNGTHTTASYRTQPKPTKNNRSQAEPHRLSQEESKILCDIFFLPLHRFRVAFNIFFFQIGTFFFQIGTFFYSARQFFFSVRHILFLQIGILSFEKIELSGIFPTSSRFFQWSKKPFSSFSCVWLWFLPWQKGRMVRGPSCTQFNTFAVENFCSPWFPKPLQIHSLWEENSENADMKRIAEKLAVFCASHKMFHFNQIAHCRRQTSSIQKWTAQQHKTILFNAHVDCGCNWIEFLLPFHSLHFAAGQSKARRFTKSHKITASNRNPMPTIDAGLIKRWFPNHDAREDETSQQQQHTMQASNIKLN